METEWPTTCDGSGWVEAEEPDRGIILQRRCPGCERCLATVEAATETMEVTAETLRDLFLAYQSLTGPIRPGTNSGEAMGLIISYLPALIEMASTLLLDQAEPVRQVRVSPHTLLRG